MADDDREPPAVVHYRAAGWPGRSECGAVDGLHTSLWALVTCRACRGPMAFEPLRPDVEAEF